MNTLERVLYLFVAFVCLPGIVRGAEEFTRADVPASGPSWVSFVILALLVALGVGVVLVYRKVHTAMSGAAPAPGTVPHSVLSDVLALFHKTADAHAVAVEVLANPVVQRAVETLPQPGSIGAPANAPAPAARLAPDQPASAQAPANLVGGTVQSKLLPGGTPVAELPLYQGAPRVTEFVYPDEDDYRRSGNEPPWGWREVLRTVNGVPPRRGAPPPGNLGYHEGDAPGTRATEQQAALIAIVRNSALSAEIRAKAEHDLIDSLGFPGQNADAGTPANVALARLYQDNPVNG